MCLAFDEVITHADGSGMSVAIIRLCDSVCLSARLNQRLKVINQAWQRDSPSRYLAHQWILGQRSRLELELGDRVAGVSNAPLSSAALVIYKQCLSKLVQDSVEDRNVLSRRRKLSVDNDGLWRLYMKEFQVHGPAT